MLKPEDDPDAITFAMLPDDIVRVRDFTHGGTRAVTAQEWLEAERRRIGPGVEIAASGLRIYLRKTTPKKTTQLDQGELL